MVLIKPNNPSRISLQLPQKMSKIVSEWYQLLLIPFHSLHNYHCQLWLIIKQIFCVLLRETESYSSLVSIPTLYFEVIHSILGLKLFNTILCSFIQFLKLKNNYCFFPYFSKVTIQNRISIQHYATQAAKEVQLYKIRMKDIFRKL